MSGGGQSGVAVAFGLARARVTNVLVIDKAVRGREGPWRTYARMPTLRSPKDYTGPDLDIPSLTYQSWHEAKFGAESWETLGNIPRDLWADYLLWVRDVTATPVRNETTLVDIAPAAGLLAATVQRSDGKTEVLHARKILLATGQDGMGLWWMPPLIAGLPAPFRAHCADEIDFASLRDKDVAVVGAGASALDNAAMALEHGAREVLVLCRRDTVQVVQPYRWLTFRGFLAHLGDLDDAWRWRFMSRVLGLREGFPQETYDRCARHAGFRIVTGAPLNDARVRDSRVEIDTPQGTFAADFVICGTGIDMDFAGRPRAARICPKYRYLGRPLHAPRIRTRQSLGPLPLPRARFQPGREGRGPHPLDLRHPPLLHRLDHELRPLGLLHQRHDHSGPEGRLRPHAWPVCRRRRAPLGFPAGLRRAPGRAADPVARPPPPIYRGGSRRLSWNSRSHFTNMRSVSITSWNPACISLIVEEKEGGAAWVRPNPIW